MKWRKKPVVIEAMLFTNESKQDVINWATEIQYNIQHSWDKNKQPCLIVPTLEGDMICSVGDYLIKEPFPTDWRKFYPCKPDIFEKTYEPVDESPLTEVKEHQGVETGSIYWYQPLFDLMSKEHDKILFKSEMDDIIITVQKMLNQ